MFESKNKKSINGWRIIFKHLLSYKREIVVLTILGVISALANGSVPYIVGRFFDAILDSSRVFTGTLVEMPLWLFLIIIWATVQSVANIVDWINDKKGKKISILLDTIYTSKGFGYLLKLPLSFHKDRKAGEIGDRITRAGQWLSRIIENVVLRLAPQFLSVVVGLIIAISINYWFGLILILGVASYVGVLAKIVPPAVKLQERAFEVFGNAYGNLYGTLTNIQSVKQSTAENYESKRMYKGFVFSAGRLWNKIQIIWSGVSFYQRVIVTLTQLSIFVLAVHFIQNGQMTLGELIALNGYAMMVFGPFVTLGYNWQTVQSGIVAIERAEKLFNVPTEIYAPKEAIVLSGIKGDIEFKDVSFYYKKRELNILNDITFKVRAGEIIALVGESGVGKSTLIDLISGYYFPTKGKVLIDGHDIKKLDLRFLRERIAVVPQEVILFNDTIRVNIKYGSFDATNKEIEEAAKKAHADVFIEKFPKKYNQIVGERGIKLSAGQKQRIVIARAILRNPNILILDEPTSALDSKTEHLITESLEELMKGRTTFIIAHRLSTVRRANRIFVIDEGKIVEEGRHENLIKIKGGVYQNLYNLHMGLK